MEQRGRANSDEDVCRYTKVTLGTNPAAPIGSRRTAITYYGSVAGWESQPFERPETVE